jgi:hypothetical protein
MSEDNNSEFKDVPLAQLEDGEALIPDSLVEKYKEAVEQNKNNKAEEAKEPEAENVISSDKAATSPNLSITSNEENVIGSASANKKEAIKPSAAKNKDMVAIHSTKNVSWSGVGSVSRGYNIVTKEASVKWLTRYHIRLATPEEVARDFGK